MWKSIHSFFNPAQSKHTFPTKVTEHLKMDDWNVLFDFLNLTTCYDTHNEDKVNGTQLIFSPNGKELKFFLYYATEFGRHQYSYRSDVYEIIDAVIDELTFEQKKFLIDTYFDENHTNYDFIIKFNKKMFSQRYQLMSQLCQEILIFDNIRIHKINGTSIDFYADCRDYKDMLITVYSGYYPSWVYPTVGASLEVSRDILSKHKPVLEKYPGISFEIFELHSDSFVQKFISKPIVKEYITNARYQLIASFDNTKKIPDNFVY